MRRKARRPIFALRGVPTAFFIVAGALLPRTRAAESEAGPSPRPMGAWSAPPQCIGEVELLDRVQASFARGDVPRAHTVTGIAQVRGESLEVRFSVTEKGRPVGQRVLQLPADPCRDNDEALVLVFSLLLEHGPTAYERAEPEPRALEPQTGPGPEREPSPSTRARDHLSASFGYLYLSGWTKGSPGGLEGTLSWALPARLWLGIDGAYLPPHTSDAGPAQLKNWGGYVAGHLCYGLGWDRFGLLGCGLGGAAFLRARGARVDEAESVHFESAFVGLRAELRFRLASHFFLRGSAQGAAAFSRARLLIEADDVAEIAYETRPVWAAFAVGVGLTY